MSITRTVARAAAALAITAAPLVGLAASAGAATPTPTTATTAAACDDPADEDCWERVTPQPPTYTPGDCLTDPLLSYEGTAAYEWVESGPPSAVTLTANPTGALLLGQVVFGPYDVTSTEDGAACQPERYIDAVCGKAIVTFLNPSRRDVQGSYRADGGKAVHVTVAAGSDREIVVPFEEDSGDHDVAATFDGLDSSTVVVDSDCAANLPAPTTTTATPAPSPTATTSATPTAEPVEPVATPVASETSEPRATATVEAEPVASPLPPELAYTGTRTGEIVGAALALVALGGVALVMSRRMGG